MKKVVVIGLSGESVFLRVDHFNNLGETVKAEERFVEAGGKGFNQALMLGKLGIDCSFITVLGSDQYAKECVRVLQENNVKPCIITKDGLTDYAVIVTNKEGENNVIVSNNLSNMITFKDILKYQEELDNADICLLQLEYPYEVIKKIIEYCYQKGIKVILNPAPSKLLDLDILRKISILIPNEHEIYSLFKTKEENKNEIIDILKELELCGVETTIVTRGSKSVLSYNNSKLKEYKVSKTKVVDTTGAGDTFCSGIVYGLINNYSLDACINFAIQASRLSVNKKGVVNSLPTLKEILDQVSKQVK